MSELYHHGIKGMRWGVRRFQNADGSLTASGRARYNTSKGYHGALDNDGSISGRIRNKQYARAKSMADDRREALRELNDIESYAANSTSKLARSRIATAIRNKQISNAKRDLADAEEAMSELRDISRNRSNTRSSAESKRGPLDNDTSISGRIRNKQYADANRRLSESRKALRELKAIDAHASKSGSSFAQSKFATSIRNKQIAKEKRIISDSEAAISELKEISKAKGFVGGYTSVNVSQIMGDTGIHDRKR